MPSVKRLNIVGYNNEEVPNLYIDSSSNQLAVLLPGLAYSNDSPILYYTANYLIEKGISVLKVDYKYFESEKYLASSKEVQKHWLISDVEAAIKTVLSIQDFERVILVGKSIGTLAIGEILTADNQFENAEIVWLTPLFKNEELLQQVLKIDNRSLFIIGTEDPSYNNDTFAKILENDNVDSLIVEGADHSIDIENNIIESIDQSKEILLKIMRFIDKE